MDYKNVSRLFPICSKKPLLTKGQITELTQLLTGQNSKEFLSVSENHSSCSNPKIPVGFTYLGQLIAHDIVPRTRIRTSDRKVSPELNLDSIYGGVIGQTNYSLFNKRGCFEHEGRDFDVKRSEGKAAIPDLRNDENVIIVQLHRQIQKLHDKVVQRLPKNSQIEKTIDRARAITTTLFHLVVVEEYLPKILDRIVYKKYFTEMKEYIRDIDMPLESIPVEFSHAAFRFGHSIVLNAYALSSGQGATLLLKELLRGKDTGALEERLQIDWRNFFGSCSQKANEIDMLIEFDMGDIPDEGSVVFRNLTAGENMHLPSGYRVREFIQEHPSELSNDIHLTNQNYLDTGSEADLVLAYQYLQEHFERGTLPLWLYILRESVQSTNPSYALGKVGSVIVAEVIRSSILSCYPPAVARSQQPLIEILKRLPQSLEFVKLSGIEPPTQMLDLFNLFEKGE